MTLGKPRKESMRVDLFNLFLGVGGQEREQLQAFVIVFVVVAIL